MSTHFYIKHVENATFELAGGTRRTNPKALTKEQVGQEKQNVNEAGMVQQKKEMCPPSKRQMTSTPRSRSRKIGPPIPIRGWSPMELSVSPIRRTATPRTNSSNVPTSSSASTEPDYSTSTWSSRSQIIEQPRQGKATTMILETSQLRQKKKAVKPMAPKSESLQNNRAKRKINIDTVDVQDSREKRGPKIIKKTWNTRPRK